LNIKPSLSLIKSSSLRDDKITYTFRVTNTGNVVLKDVKVIDDKISTTPICTVDTLAVDASKTCTAEYTLTDTDKANGIVLNKAVATGTSPDGKKVNVGSTTTNPSDSDITGDNNATKTLLVGTIANDSKTARPGATVIVDVVANDDDVNASTVMIVDDNGQKVSKLVVAGEGTWTVNPNTGAITFIPESGFSGTPTSIEYTANDNNGNNLGLATVIINVEEDGLVNIKSIYWIDDNKDGKADSTEERIYGATVELLDANGKPVLDSNGKPMVTTTKADGTYEFAGVPAGQYQVRFTLPQNYIDDGYGAGNQGNVISVDARGDKTVYSALAPVICAGCEGANGASALGWISGIIMIIMMGAMAMFMRREEELKI